MTTGLLRADQTHASFLTHNSTVVALHTHPSHHCMWLRGTSFCSPKGSLITFRSIVKSQSARSSGLCVARVLTMIKQSNSQKLLLSAATCTLQCSNSATLQQEQSAVFDCTLCVSQDVELFLHHGTIMKPSSISLVFGSESGVD